MDYKNEIIELLDRTESRPMSDEEIFSNFKIEKKGIGKFFSDLDELEKEGLIFRTKKEKYVLPKRINLVVGKLKKNRKGFGFIIPDSDTEGDVYVAQGDMNSAMNGDTVVVRLQDEASDSKSREGEIIKILVRKNNEVVGTFEKSTGFAFVTPDDTRIDKDIFISKNYFSGANTGDKVVARITKWAKEGRNPEGKIVEVLGASGDVGTDIVAIIRQYNKTEDFPSKVVKEVKNISLDIPKDEVARRLDLRKKTIFTIDGADAKDLDDAVSVTKKENGNYILGVHIADVTHYVKEHTSLDSEALKRGTSVYLIDRVIPMLPKILSNGMCSLNPKVDRLTLSIEMEINSNGTIVSHNIYESIINSTERLVYTDVSDIIENNDENLIKKYKHIHEDIVRMDELATILRKKRKERGSIDFDFDEAFIKLNEEGVPVGIYAAERRIANRIIEEFMLKANETIAEHFFWMEMPFVYRIHEEPSVEKINDFRKFIHNFGYSLKGSTESVHPKALQELTDQLKGSKEENVINRIMLRSLKKAEYTGDNRGHFGLAAEYYCHFTSPIRRYPDLMIHRIIKEVINTTLSKKRIDSLRRTTDEVAAKSSEAEKVAQEMERDVDDLKKAEYMSYHIGENFQGIISGVTSFGMFIELPNTIEGLVRISSVDDDYYIYDKDNYRLIGERTKKQYILGQEVNIKVIGVDILNREINFELVK